MKQKSSMPWFGLFALAISAGCSHAPVQQVAKKPPDTVPAKAGKAPAAQVAHAASGHAPLPITGHDSVADRQPVKADQAPAAQVAHAASDHAPLSTIRHDSVASTNSKPETPKTTLVSGLPIQQPVSSSKMDSLPFLNVKSEAVKHSDVAMVSPTVPVEKKPGTSRPQEKKAHESEPIIKQTKLEIALPPIVETSPTKKSSPLPVVVDSPLPKKIVAPPVINEGVSARADALSPATNNRTGHAADYSWLRGQLQYWPLHKTWRLRYAGLDEVDPYGGSVTLAEDVRPSDLKEGQFVRVEGRLVDPASKNIAPMYEVRSIHPTDK